MIEVLFIKVVLLVALLMVPVLLVFLAIGTVASQVAKKIKRDTERQGGAKVVAAKVVAGTAAKYAGRALRKRFFG
jgi:hypothetical protein